MYNIVRAIANAQRLTAHFNVNSAPTSFIEPLSPCAVSAARPSNFAAIRWRSSTHIGTWILAQFGPTWSMDAGSAAETLRSGELCAALTPLLLELRRAVDQRAARLARASGAGCWALNGRDASFWHPPRRAQMGPDCVKTPSDGFLQRERCVRIGT